MTMDIELYDSNGIILHIFSNAAAKCAIGDVLTIQNDDGDKINLIVIKEISITYFKQKVIVAPLSNN